MTLFSPGPHVELLKMQGWQEKGHKTENSMHILKYSCIPMVGKGVLEYKLLRESETIVRWEDSGS